MNEFSNIFVQVEIHPSGADSGRSSEPKESQRGTRRERKWPPGLLSRTMEQHPPWTVGNSLSLHGPNKQSHLHNQVKVPFFVC